MADYPVLDGLGATIISAANSGIGGKSESDTVDDVADVTLNNGSTTVLLAADDARREAVIVADPANTVAIRVGAVATVGAARGAQLQPGQGITLTTTGAINGFASAASQKVSITITKD